MTKPGLVEATAAAPTLTAPAVVRVLIALAVLTRLVPVLLAPDAWIDLAWCSDHAAATLLLARRLLEGHLLSVDDGSVTNGAAPLWLMLEIPIVAVARHGLLPLKLVGALQALLAGPAAVLIARLAEPRGKGAVRLALILWAIAPVFVIGTVDGATGGLAALMVLVLLVRQRALIARTDPRHDVDTRYTLRFGALCGLAALARPDLLLLCGPLLIHRLWLLAERGLRTDELIRVTAGVLLGGLLVFGPWLVVSTVVSGAVMPTSLAAWRQAALELGWANLPSSWQPTAADPFDPDQVPWGWTLEHAGLLIVVAVLQHPLLAWLRPAAPFTPTAPPTEALFGWLPGGLVLVVALAAAGWALRHWMITPRPRPSLVGPLSAWGLLHLLVVPSVAPAPTAYGALLLPLLAGTLPLWAGVLVDGDPLLPSWRRPVGWSVAGLVLLVQLLGGMGAVGALRAQPDAKQAPPVTSVRGAWAAMAPKIHEQARVGAFDAHLVEWLADRPPVNLDGAFSTQALDARRRGKLASFVCSRGVDVVVVRGRAPPAALLAERDDFLRPLWSRRRAALSAWTPDCPRATDPETDEGR